MIVMTAMFGHRRLRRAFTAFGLSLACVLSMSVLAEPANARGQMVPGAPESFTLGAIDTSTIRLAWLQPSSEVTQYEVHNGVESRAVDAPQDTSSVTYDWTGLTPGQWMCFRVRALDETGVSPWTPPEGERSYKCALTPQSDLDLRSFPFWAGVDAYISQGFHGKSFRSIADKTPGVVNPKIYQFENPGEPLALDVVSVPDGEYPVVSVEGGIVLAVDPECHHVVIDSGDRIWVYNHVEPDALVGSGQTVDRGMLIGRTTDTPNAVCGEESTPPGDPWTPHLHLVMAQPPGTTDAKYKYVSMQGQSFCGHLLGQVNGQMIFDGLAYETAERFTVPLC